MKKLLVIAFSLFYILAGTGVNLTMHFCHGELSYVEAFDTEGPCCCPVTGADDDCCFERIININKQDDHLTSQVQAVSYDQDPVEAAQSFSDIGIGDTTAGDQISICKSFPSRSDHPIWLRNCSLVFYG